MTMIRPARFAFRVCVTALAALGIIGCATVEEKPVVTAPPPAAPPPPPKAKVAAPPPPKVEVEAPPEPPPQRPPIVVYRPSEVEWLINEFQRLRKLPAAEVTREQESARQAFILARSDTARVRYAMTLALPGTAPSDDAKALDMLEPVVRNGSSTLNGFAVLLASYIQEQRRLAAQVQALQQKLEALRALERNLSERRR